MQPYPWQQRQWKQVIHQCAHQRTSNTFLLIGPEGLGKMTFAMALAQWLLCESSSMEFACGQCCSCRWMISQTHPDFFTLLSSKGLQDAITRPLSKLAAVREFEGGSERRTAAYKEVREDSSTEPPHKLPAAVEVRKRSIRVEQVRGLLDQLIQTPVYSSLQVCLISPVEAMNRASANALLKTLEEPVGRVIFILISHCPSQIPLTIRSRAQTILFSIPPASMVKSWLKDQISICDIDLLLSISGGLPLKALTLGNDANACNARNLLFDGLIQLIQMQSNPVAVAEKLLKFDVLEMLKHWFTIVIDLMRMMMDVDSTYLIHQDKKQALSFFAQHSSIRSLIYYQHELREVLRNYYNHPNLNQTLLLEYLLIQWRKMCS